MDFGEDGSEDGSEDSPVGVHQAAGNDEQAAGNDEQAAGNGQGNGDKDG